jgi:hypothetical protein
MFAAYFAAVLKHISTISAWKQSSKRLADILITGSRPVKRGPGI